MAWSSAVPNVDGFAWARHVFQTHNDRGVCAGYSQTWLTLSLIAGQPHTNPGLMSNQAMIQTIHQGKGRYGGQQKHTALGSSSVKTLPESGLNIQPGYPKHPASTGWKDIFDSLASEGVGYYYLTIKAPFVHAMACIFTAAEAYYLEPEKGLYLIPKAKLSESLTGFYSQYAWSASNDYKIYQVSN